MVTMKPSNRLFNIEKSCSNVATNATNFSQNKTVSYFNFTKVVEALNETQSPYDFNKLAEGLCVAEKAEVAMKLKPLKEEKVCGRDVAYNDQPPCEREFAREFFVKYLLKEKDNLRKERIPGPPIREGELFKVKKEVEGFKVKDRSWRYEQLFIFVEDIESLMNL
uniref:Uncharacterized protein n=1 Tax=Fagus sylvatica TaxID=28930 RepID=A0A2N9HNK0_FAGSY